MSIKRTDHIPLHGGSGISTESPAPKQQARVRQSEAAPSQNVDGYSENELSFSSTVAQMPILGSGKMGVFKSNIAPSNPANSSSGIELSAHELAAGNPQGLQNLVNDIQKASRADEIDLRSLSDEQFIAAFARMSQDADDKNIG